MKEAVVQLLCATHERGGNKEMQKVRESFNIVDRKRRGSFQKFLDSILIYLEKQY